MGIVWEYWYTCGGVPVLGGNSVGMYLVRTGVVVWVVLRREGSTGGRGW